MQLRPSSLQVAGPFRGFPVSGRMAAWATGHCVLPRSGVTGECSAATAAQPPAATRRCCSSCCHLPLSSNSQSLASTPRQPASPTPIFGASATFGGTGFGGFSGVAAKAAGDEGTAEEGGEEEAAAEEECQAEFKPVVQLEEVEVSTGEEDEEPLFDAKCKLYRFDNDAGEWKERGVGQGRILRHKENKKIRFLMRQDKTLKIRGNHIIMPGTAIKEHGGSDKAMVWSCVDFADESQKMELFCIRFASAERAQEFQKAYHAAADAMKELIGAPGFVEQSEESKAADELAAEVEKKAAVDDKEEA